MVANGADSSFIRWFAHVTRADYWAPYYTFTVLGLRSCRFKLPYLKLMKTPECRFEHGRE